MREQIAADDIEYDETVADGKYRVVYAKGITNVNVFRHGERWTAMEDQIEHQGFILALVQDLAEAREIGKV